MAFIGWQLRLERLEQESGIALALDVRDHKVVPRAGGGDVEEASLLGDLSLLLVVPDRVVVGRRVVAAARLGPDAKVKSRVLLLRHGLGLVSTSGREIRHHDDGKLEALRAVHGQQTDHVVALLRDVGVHLPGPLLGVLCQPAGECPRAPAAGRGEGAGLVDDAEQVRGCLRAVRQGERELDHAAAVKHLLHQLGEAELGAAPVELAEPSHRLGDPLAVALGLGAVVPAATRAPMDHDVVVRAAEC